MSRYSLKVKDSETKVKELIVGYDPPLGAFFFQAFGAPDVDGEDTFAVPQEFRSSPEKVLLVIAKYAELDAVPDSNLAIICMKAISAGLDPREYLKVEDMHWSSHPPVSLSNVIIGGKNA